MKSMLLTGAFGNLGCYVLDLLLERGYQVTCFDLPNKANQKAAEKYQGRVEIVWGDIRDTLVVNPLVANKTGVIHLAAMLPPATDDLPELSWQVNVESTRNLLTAISEQEGTPVFVFASSFTVFGMQQPGEAPRKPSDPITASDNYTKQKVACEEAIQAHSKPWAILRVGVSIDARLQHADKRLIRAMLEVTPDSCLEYVHPADVAIALVHAVEREAAWRKVHLIGGGKNCQVLQRDLVNTALGAAGLVFSDAELGDKLYYTHWMDTEETQRILEFQHHSFDDFREAMFKQMKWIRLLVKPIAYPARKIFLKWAFAG